MAFPDEREDVEDEEAGGAVAAGLAGGLEEREEKDKAPLPRDVEAFELSEDDMKA